MASVDTLAYYALLIILPLLLIGRQIRRWRIRAKYPPGPTALPVIGHLHIFLRKPLLHRTFYDLSSRYGHLMYFRVGKTPIVVASSPEILTDMFKNHDITFSGRAYNAATYRLTYGNNSFGFSPYGPYWTFVKKMAMSELLGNRMLDQSLPFRTRELHEFIGICLDKAAKRERVNLTAELNRMTSNSTSQMLMGVRCAATPTEADAVFKLVRDVTQIAGVFNLSEIFWFDFQGFRNWYEDIFQRLDGLLENVLRKKREQRKTKKSEAASGDSKDFMEKLLDLMEDSNAEIQINDNHIKGLIMDLLIAGIDTTALAMEFAMVELMNHPDILKKVRDEIDEVIGKSRLVEEHDIGHLTYLQAVIKETFRLHPPIPMFVRRANEDCEINGYIIPQNSTVFVNVWAIGRDPKTWEDPLEFRPTRFLNENGGLTSIDLKGHHFQLLPFGTGRRICPGISLTLQDITTTVAAMIQCFEWEAKDGVIDMSERPGLVVPRIKPLELFPTVRFTPKISNL